MFGHNFRFKLMLARRPPCWEIASESSCWSYALFYLSLDARKPNFCLGENKGADQLCSNCTADQRLCFRYTDHTIPLIRLSKISSFQSFAVTVQAGYCRTWSETHKTGFLASLLILWDVLYCSFLFCLVVC